MVRMIMELVRNQSFTLTTGDSKQSRLRRLKKKPRSYFAWSFKWVLRYSPSETKTRPFVPSARNHLDSIEHLASALLNGQITNGKRSTVKMVPGSVLLCSRPVPGLLGWAYPKQFGLSSTACGLVLGDSIRPCTNGVSLLHRIASVAPLSKPQTMY